MDHYQTLGVSKDATAQEIKKAFRKLAMKHHPDRGGDENKFKEIQTAYDVLSDPDKKQQYDNPNPFGEGFNFDGDPFGQGNPFGDIFRDIFGQRQARQPQRNPDGVVDLHLDLHEVYTGTEKIINTGYGQFKIVIPAGTHHGTKFNMHGKGPTQYEHLPPGDLIVRCHVYNSPEWDRRNNDLYVKVQVDYFQSLLGDEIRITHLDGKMFDIKIPKKTPPGATLRLSAKGMPDPRRSNVRGNLIVVVEVVPPEMDDKQLQRLDDFLNKE